MIAVELEIWRLKMQMRMTWSIRKIQLLFRTTIDFIHNNWGRPSKCRETSTRCIKSTQAKSFKARSGSLSSINQRMPSCLLPSTSNTTSKSNNSFSLSSPTKWTRCFTLICISSRCSKMRWRITLIPDKMAMLLSQSVMAAKHLCSKKIYSSNSILVPVATKSKDTNCNSLWKSGSSVNFSNNNSSKTELWLTQTKTQYLCLQALK